MHWLVLECLGVVGVCLRWLSLTRHQLVTARPMSRCWCVFEVVVVGMSGCCRCVFEVVAEVRLPVRSTEERQISQETVFSLL